jgi:hypothetical protein
MGQAHDHRQVDYGRAFTMGIGLNLEFVVLETVAGLAIGSLPVSRRGHFVAIPR